jgi:hypothetical protein
MNTRMRTLLIGSVAVLAMLTGTAGAAPQLTEIDEEGPGLAPNDPIVGISDAVAQESDGHINFTVSLNKAATSNTTVDVAVAHGETNGSDFTGLVDQTAFFLAGSTGATVTLTLDADDGVEPAETFVATLSNADGLTIGDGSGAGTVLDGDGPVLDLGDTEVLEGQPGGGSELAFTVGASYAPLSDVTFDFLTGTLGFEAEPDTDFTPVATTGVLDAGTTEATLTVPVVGDTDVEDDELVIAFIEQVNAGSIDDGTALGRILDDDVVAPAGSGSGTGEDTATPADATPTTSVDLNTGIGELAAGLNGERASDVSTRSIGLLLLVAGLGIVVLSWVVARRIRENEQERTLAVPDGSLDATMHG